MTRRNEPAVDGRDPKAVEIGQRIAQARREMGIMTQEELAQLIGVSPRSMQAYELGEVIPYKQMKDLETVLERPIGWILHGEDAVQARDQQIEMLLEVAAKERQDLMKELRANRKLLREIADKLLVD